MAKKKKDTSAEAPEPEVTETEASESGGGRKKWLLIGGAAVLLLCLIAGGVYWFVLRDTSAPESEKTETAAAPSESDVDIPLQESTDMDEALSHNIFPMEPFVIELMDPDPKRILSLTVSLEMIQPETVDEIRNMLPYIRETVMQHFIQTSSGDLMAMEDKLVTKHELIQKINGLLSYGRIRNVYFTQFLIR